MENEWKMENGFITALGVLIGALLRRTSGYELKPGRPRDLQPSLNDPPEHWAASSY